MLDIRSSYTLLNVLACISVCGLCALAGAPMAMAACTLLLLLVSRWVAQQRSLAHSYAWLLARTSMACQAGDRDQTARSYLRLVPLADDAG